MVVGRLSAGDLNTHKEPTMNTRTLAATTALVILAGCISGAYLAANADLSFEGAVKGRTGFAVLGGHDFTGDGHADLVVTSPNPGFAKQRAGNDTVFIVPGPFVDGAGAALDISDAHTFIGEIGGEAGSSVAVGEVYQTPAGWGGWAAPFGKELLVGAPSANNERGQVDVLVDGSMYKDRTSGTVRLLGSNDGWRGEYAGWDIATGDFNGDGNDDVLVGAPGYTPEQNLVAAGRAYVIYGPLAKGDFDLADSDVILDGEIHQGFLGGAVAAADLDGDGQDEIILGAIFEAAGEGNVHIIYDVPNGVHAISEVPDQSVVNGVIENQQLGFSLDAGQDVNGDGVQDLLIGAPSYFCHLMADLNRPACPTGYGTAYLILGEQGERLDTTLSITQASDFAVTGTTIANGLGVSVSMQADVDGDGKYEMLIGSRDANTAWLFYGDAEVGDGLTAMDDTDAMATFDGTAEGLFLGISVAGVHDLDGDGYDEILIGAPGQEWFEQGPQPTTGMAYLWFGESRDE